MIRALAFLIVATVFPPQAPSRDATAQTQTGTASISGVVMAAADKQPIGFARVALNSTERITYANAKGEFLFPNLPAGRYAISAQANGYLPISLGQKQPGRPGVSQVLAASEGRKGVVLAMRKGGVISGHVVGPDGRALADVFVSALRKGWAQDGSATFQHAVSGKTDDRGDYRIPGLPAGAYLVEATPQMVLGLETPSGIDDGQRLATEGMIQTFYPGTTDPISAVPLTVDLDAERAGIDFNIQATPMRTVAGRVDGVAVMPMVSRSATGDRQVMNAGSVRLIPPGDAPGAKLAGNSARGPFAVVGPDGRFRFGAVPAGQYELVYQGGSMALNAAVPAAYGVSTVTVGDRDVDDANVTARVGLNIAGEIVAAIGQGNSASTPVFGLIPLAGPLRGNVNLPPTRIDTPGKFTLSGLAPGRYALRPSAPTTGVYLSKIEVDGASTSGALIDLGERDLSNVRVTYSTDMAEVSGNVRHEDLSPVTEYALVIFPADKREWPIWMMGAGVSSADSSGRYTYSTRPGTYLIAAVDDVEQNQWLDPTFLESLIPTATKVTLGPRQKLSQDFIVK